MGLASYWLVYWHDDLAFLLGPWRNGYHSFLSYTYLP